ncbi:MAG TPA: DUF4844 domain-containing protein [Flavobacteriales bacterium]|jgi:hypothetical protein|nr:DUF4844 domain-containing protein [Flavobacteriales bacterium]
MFDRMKIPPHAEEQLLALLKSEKYVKEPQHFYPGIMDEQVRPQVSRCVDDAVHDFLTIVKSGKGSKKAYRDAIRDGLARFEGTYLDTEDRERTARYFEQMMDAVGLDSSGGLLNAFV